MDHDSSEPKPLRTLRSYVASAWGRVATKRPISFYLLLMMLVIVLIGSPIVYGRDNPKEFVLLLGLNFIVFFVILAFAAVDFVEICRDHFREREQAYKETLGDEEFVAELARRMQVADEERE